MKRHMTFAVASLLLLFGGSATATAQVKSVQMKIDGYLAAFECTTSRRP